jgi:tRNA uridine 5-carboxymethylaminomethyl modification enzyme
LQRHEGYIGVLIDDLVTKGTNEPYRMFTSRAEHRLLFNHGSAELRLLHHAKAHGLLSASRIAAIEAKQTKIADCIDFLERTRTFGGTWADAIRRNQSTNIPLALPDELMKETVPIREEALYRVAYQGYLDREHRHIEKLAHIDKIRLPADLDYLAVRGLRREGALKLAEARPLTLGQASRISGVNPSDVSVLMIFMGAGRGE